MDLGESIIRFTERKIILVERFIKEERESFGGGRI